MSEGERSRDDDEAPRRPRPALAAVQAELAGLYDLPLTVSVEDFVCDEALARTLGGDDAILRREVLFVLEDDAGVHVGLYLAREAIEAVGDPSGWHTRFEAMCLATEGVSHFVLLQFRSDHHAPVRELELELQAEVDKYALGLLAGNGVGLLRERSRQVRRRLFDDAELIDAPGTERGERYRTATRLADEYTRRLEQTHVARGDLGGLRSELRRFYRLGLAEKLERCRGPWRER